MNVGNVFEVDAPVSVLLVDSEPGYAALTSEVLSAHGDIETELVATPSEALDRLDTSRVDCIVSEYSFTNTTGLDFLRTVRESRPDLPFVLFTRHGSEGVASEAIAAGVTDYLRKDASSDTFDILAHRITNAVSATRQSSALEQMRLWYEAIVEESHVGLYVVRNGRIAFANDYLLELLGYDASDVIGHPIVEFVAEHDRHIVEDRIAPKTYGSLESTTYTVDIVNEHGRPVALEITSRRVTLGDQVVNVGAATDVTARIASEREIRRSERITRQVISSLPDMVFLSEPDAFDIVYINDAFKEMWGRPKSTLYEDSLSFLDLVHVDDRAPLEQAVEEIFRDVADETVDDRYEFEFRFVPEGDETVRWATTQAVPLYDEDGNITNVLGVMSDLTERIRREQKLTQQNARLEAFARVLSHDIRGPLAVAQGRLDLARETGDDSHLDHVERAQRRIAEVVEDVLSLTYDDRAVVDLSTVDLVEAASSAWVLCGPDASHARVEISDLPTVQANQSQMKRLFENLFRNSVEHGSTGNRTDPDAAIGHAGESSDSTLVIRVGELPSSRGFFVEDDGRGFPRSIRDRLFDAGVSTKDDGENGLGLSIVRKIVHTHGWLIRTAESDAGGARLEVLFDTVGNEGDTT
ncbi:MULTISPECIES: PAS domain S-box protein [Haloferax]|uniref:histidine kinase n=1 Tax=Haloferax marinum TaxID=2666143 RepID=A0A6A8G6Q3_9EURY|nr:MULTISPECIES: PAS domain S-box protein [Haloferax]KAB1197442.1 PAS domain S-box protein [Haloferax sp. CBA1150]MRW96487.1 PAS domain S-box protein [Haloferax marinum]